MDAAEFVPAGARSIATLARAAQGCRGCELYADATQVVFGAGPKTARVMLVGEQPGDVEDRRGEPFVGPAGKLLDRALAEAEFVREQVYLTNAVKHFRWKSTASNKRRLHQKPDARHVGACVPWLSAELRVVRPAVLVALGATAVQSLFGPSLRLTQHRGERLAWPPDRGPFAQSDVVVGAAFVTVHPSAVLRADDRKQAFAGLVADLRLVHECAESIR